MRINAIFICIMILFISLPLIGCKPSEQEQIANASKLSPEVLDAIKNSSSERILVVIEVSENSAGTFNKIYDLKDIPNTTVTHDFEKSLYFTSISVDKILELINFQEITKIRHMRTEEKIIDAGFLLDLFSENVSTSQSFEVYVMCFGYIKLENCRSEIGSYSTPYNKNNWTSIGNMFIGTVTKENILELVNKDSVGRISKAESVSRAYVENKRTDNLPFETIAKGEDGGYGTTLGKDKKFIIITNVSDWRYYWNISKSRERLPVVNFTNETILAVYQGAKSTGGYTIRITRINTTEDPVKVYVTEVPASGPVSQGHTYPYHIVRIPKPNKPLIFISS
jgi:hypothetical protein